jgi:hypothetical protein
MVRYRINRMPQWVTATDVRPFVNCSGTDEIANFLRGMPVQKAAEYTGMRTTIRYLMFCGPGELHWKCNGVPQVYCYEWMGKTGCPNCGMDCGDHGSANCYMTKILLGVLNDSLEKF